MMKKLKAWAGSAVMALAAGCAPGGGGGGGGRPLVIEVEGFNQWFEIREDGAWPKCPAGVDVEVMDFDDNITRVCAGTEHFARTAKGDGVIYQWRYEAVSDAPEVQRRNVTVGERGTGLALVAENYGPCTPSNEACADGQEIYCSSAKCWAGGCALVNSACAGVVERFDVEAGEGE